MMDVKLIKTEADYREALAQIDALMDVEDDSPEGDCLELLATLVEAYEAEYFPIGLPDPIAAIEFAMEQRGLSRRDLEPAIGSRARVSEVLNRKRALTLEMIRKLVPLLGVPAEVLIQPYEVHRNAA